MRRYIYLVIIFLFLFSNSSKAFAIARIPQPSKTPVLIPYKWSPSASRSYAKSYRGSRYTDEYLDQLETYCTYDQMAVAIAISLAETGMGSTSSKHANWYGIRGYDGSYKEVAQRICYLLNTKYDNIAYSTRQQRTWKCGPYANSCNTSGWNRNVWSVLNKMK